MICFIGASQVIPLLLLLPNVTGHKPGFPDKLDFSLSLQPFASCLVEIISSQIEFLGVKEATYEVLPPSFPHIRSLHLYKFTFEGPLICNGIARFKISPFTFIISKLENEFPKLTCVTRVLINPSQCFKWQTNAHSIEQLIRPEMAKLAFPSTFTLRVYEGYSRNDFNYFIQVIIGRSVPKLGIESYLLLKRFAFAVWARQIPFFEPKDMIYLYGLVPLLNGGISDVIKLKYAFVVSYNDIINFLFKPWINFKHGGGNMIENIHWSVHSNKPRELPPVVTEQINIIGKSMSQLRRW